MLRQCNLPFDTLSIKASKPLRLDYSSTHKELVQACAAGDRKAQFELYRLYSKAMYNICLRMLNDQEDAEDLLQQSFIDVFLKLDSFRFESSIGAWIKRIVVNNCINFLKKRRLTIQSLDDERMGGISENPDDDLHESHLSVQEVKKAIAKLPDGYRVVFTLYLFEGYDHKEIADILNITEATSKSQYSRAKKKLRELLSDREYAGA